MPDTVSRRRRGFRRVAATLAALALALLAGGCGGGGGAATDREKASDAEVLDAALADELTAADAYGRGLPLLRGPLLAAGRELHAQELEYVDAITKAIRGLGGETDAEPSQLDFGVVKDQADFLALAYRLENAALAAYLDAVRRLETTAPRSLAASLAAGHAQHLVVLRQGLGAGPAASDPEAFDPGELPPPAPSR